MQCMRWERKGKEANLKPQDCNCDMAKKKNQRILPVLVACALLCPAFIQELY